jgi:hypothetical protein
MTDDARARLLALVDSATMRNAKKLLKRLGGENADVLSRLISDVEELAALKAPKHEWEFYANGSFCRRCGAAIGSGMPCR